MDRPAFPVPDHEYPNSQDGMTLREWYAGRAIDAVVARVRFPLRDIVERSNYEKELGEIVTRCFDLADAMVKESEKRSKG